MGPGTEAKAAIESSEIAGAQEDVQPNHHQQPTAAPQFVVVLAFRIVRLDGGGPTVSGVQKLVNVWEQAAGFATFGPRPALVAGGVQHQTTSCPARLEHTNVYTCT